MKRPETPVSYTDSIASGSGKWASSLLAFKCSRFFAQQQDGRCSRLGDKR